MPEITPLSQARVKAALSRLGLKAPLSFARRVLLRPKTLLEEWEFWNDYRTFKRECGFLSEGASRSRSSEKILVLSLTDWLAQVKTAGLFAKALQLAGCTPVVLTQRAFTRSLKYYRAFGFEEVLFFDDFMPAGIPEHVTEQLEALFRGPCHVQAVKCVHYQEVQVGQQALATLLRRWHRGRLDLGDEAVRQALRGLMVQGVRAVEAAEAVLSAVQPTLGLANDAMYIGVGAVYERALHRGIPMIQWVSSQRDDALALKRYDRATQSAHPFSLSEQTWEAMREEPWTARKDAELMQDFQDRYVRGKWDSYYNRVYGAYQDCDTVRRQVGLDPAKKTAVIFPHILWDPTLFWGEDLFEDYEQWLLETVRAACRNPAVNWVVRLHPANVWKLKLERLGRKPLEQDVLERQLGPLPSHVMLLKTEAAVNTFALCQVTDYCVTVRGTIGIEMAAFGIPVLTAGTGRYSGRGFTVDSSTREDYLAKLHRIQDIPRLSPPQTELAKKYAHTLFIRRPTPFSTFRIKFRSLADAAHPFCNNVLIAPRSFEQFARAKDLQRFAEWALHSQAYDLLTPPLGEQALAEPAPAGREG